MVKVCIDPGHGGTDRHNKGPTNYIEADGMLQLSKYLKEELEKNQIFNVVLTRNIDKTMNFAQRVDVARRHNADLLLSQHSNAGGGTGPEVFYSLRQPDNRAFAQALSYAIAEATGKRDRGAKTRESSTRPGYDYYTLIYTAVARYIPHVFIVENLFHDNAEEEKILKSEQGLRTIAKAQATVIRQFFGVEETQDPVHELEELLNRMGGLTVFAARLKNEVDDEYIKARLNMVVIYASQVEVRLSEIVDLMKKRSG